MKIAYLVDSSILLDKKDKILDSEDCFFIPLHVIINKIDYLDDLNLNRSQIISKMKKAKKVSTSQPSYGEIEMVLEKVIAAGYDVLVCALIGSGLSGTQNVVYSCAIDKKLTVVNLDSKGVGAMQIQAIRMFKEEEKNGNSLLEIQAKVQHMLDVSNCYAIVEDLNYLKRGGRVSRSSAIIGTLLKVKPIVMCSKKQFGKVVSIDKVRTMKKACDRLVDIVFKDIDCDEFNFVIGNFDADELALNLKKVIEKKYPDVIVEIMDLCFAIGAHTGPKTISLFTMRK